MVNRTLVTTALESTWPSNQPILFLGEWCRRYSRKELWERHDYVTLPYHWDDRNKLYKDYKYLQDLYERVLLVLSNKLNQIHNVDHSLRYWRIIIGPWLGYFIHILFDRWTVIQQALMDKNVVESIILDFDEELLIPDNMNDFIQLFVDDRWNHYIYAKILKQYSHLKLQFKNGDNIVKNTKKSAFKDEIKRLVYRIKDTCLNVFTKKNDAVLFALYLPFMEKLKIQFSLKQIPIFRNLRFTGKLCKENSSLRSFNLDMVCHNAFETFLCHMFICQMPRFYLEYYHELKKNNTSFPEVPKFIWTSVGCVSNDIFKFWVAAQEEKGTPLILSQYGGHFGIGKWSFLEEHDMAVAKLYLSWGWSSSFSNVLPTGYLKQRIKKITCYKNKKNVLLVTTVVPRYSYWLSSIMIGSQWLDYFNDQCCFIQNLPLHIRELVMVRLHAQDYGWDQKLRWKNCFPMIQIEEGHSSLNKLIKKSCLYISTYNATTYLESLASNIPTVIFWNEMHWEIRASSLPFFSALKKAGIFHETPESAACHVEKIWDDIDGWWKSEIVQHAVNAFSRQYCNCSSYVFDKVRNSIQQVVSQ